MPTLTHLIELRPRPKQRSLLARAAGTARFAYNRGLAQWKAQAAARKVDPTQPAPSGARLRKQWNAERRAQFPWSCEVPESCGSDAFTHLQTAFDNFFARRAKFPTFKRRGEHDAFALDGRQARFDGHFVTLPKFGRVRMAEPLRFAGKVLRSLTVSRVANRWVLSVPVEMDEVGAKRKRTGNETVGVDLGIKHLAVLSTGEQIENPRPLQNALRKLARQQRTVSRRKKGSNRRKRAVLAVAKTHRVVANRRKRAIHELTAKLCRENAVVGIEGLRPKNMLKNKRLARSLSDAAFGEVRRQLAYKAPLYGTAVVELDPFEPTTKKCSACGHVGADVPLGIRTFTCAICAYTTDRDLNAAINIRTLVVRGSGHRFPKPAQARGERVRPWQRAAKAGLDEAGSGARAPS